MKAVPYSTAEIRAYDKGFKTGCRTVYLEIKEMYDRCEWPEDLQLEISDYLERWKNGRR